MTGPPGGETADEIGRLAEERDHGVLRAAIERSTARALASSSQALVFQSH
jgi:hypothetical protein